ncbi:MAG: hypothetical protein IJ409_01745 [Lachnospiraceae bacterium]|nr:hypothetical protein [Lachnospiraceae bacterium]
MVHDCPNCLAALKYNPVSGKMECNSCGGSFAIDRYKKPAAEKKAMAPKSRTEKDADAESDTMQYRIYTCSACDAELAVNKVETSTFCSYCGRPTIVFDRIADVKKPEYIIPFSISKEQAVELIRKRFEKGAYVPKEIREFEIERVRGIYIPFRLYDVGYADKQYLKYSGAYYYREAETNFHNVPMDASKQLDNELAWRLLPYHNDGLRFFDSSYMSGFYADCQDVCDEELEPAVREHCKVMFEEEVKKHVLNKESKTTALVDVVKSSPDVKVLNSAYAMFPAWFLTFRYKEEVYTIVVNGQTGKVVGAIPFEKEKAAAKFVITGILLSALLVVVVYYFRFMLGMNVMLLIIGIIYWWDGVRTLKKMKKEVSRMTSSKITKLVKDRQEEK